MLDRSAPLPDPQTLKDYQRAAVALARGLIPPGKRIPGGSLRTAVETEQLSQALSGSPLMFRTLVEVLDWAALARTGRRFQRLPPPARERLIRAWERSPVMRWPLFALGGLMKTAHFDHPDLYEAFGEEYEKGGPPEQVRWLEQVVRGDEWDEAEEIECDVVVVGTGAGGAVVGKELAEQGHAVVFLEEGSLYRRDAFRGSVITGHHLFYRDQAKVASFGNTVVPVLMGRLVGGSTAINTGTSFRTPEWILNEWCERQGSDTLSPERMRRHFDKVERQLDIGPNEDKIIGPIGEIVARGCEALGWSHFKVPRNAPDCDAQGCCDWGCPSAARKSMDVSYLPKAMARGAMIFTETRAIGVRLENGRAVGIEARTTGRGRPLRFRARATILAGGAVPTPALLLGQRLANRSGQVGRNLSLHPGAEVSAYFDEKVEGYKHVPQGVGIDQFHREVILLLGAQAPLSMGAVYFPFYGKRLSAAMDEFDHIASMGVLVKDCTQTGRVRLGPKGEPLLSYWMQRPDLEKMREGMVRIMEMFFAAGAKRCYPLGHRMPVVHNARDLDRFRKRHVGPTDILWTSFHPLGTVRMGSDPRTSVVGFDHQCHDVPGLYVSDGSTVPGPTAVNPQLTIMAMSDRAAELIGAQLED